MALLPPFAYKLGGIFHPSTNTAEPPMYAYTPTGSWGASTDSRAWWSAFSGSRFYQDFHPGVDLIAPLGTPIVAGEDSLVTKSGWSSAASGYAINLDIRWNPPITRLVHGHMLAKPLVSVGQKVKRGQLVGYVGQSGYATGPHSHHGIQIGNMIYNPLLFYPGGTRAGALSIKPYTVIKHAVLKGAGINIRTTPDLDVGTTNIFATSRADGIYTRAGTRIGALTYKFVYLGDIQQDNDALFAKVSGFSKTLYIAKYLVTIS
jgi:hypothetical protein